MDKTNFIVVCRNKRQAKEAALRFAHYYEAKYHPKRAYGNLKKLIIENDNARICFIPYSNMYVETQGRHGVMVNGDDMNVWIDDMADMMHMYEEENYKETNDENMQS